MSIHKCVNASLCIYIYIYIYIIIIINIIMFEACTAKWASLRPHFTSLRYTLRQGSKRNQSRRQPKGKSVGEKKLYRRNERWG